jgi:p24 family protein beta-1
MVRFSSTALVLCLVVSAYGLTYTIPAHQEECFYENAKPKDKIGFQFQVSSGGFLDIDVEVCP